MADLRLPTVTGSSSIGGGGIMLAPIRQKDNNDEGQRLANLIRLAQLRNLENEPDQFARQQQERERAARAEEWLRSQGLHQTADQFAQRQALDTQQLAETGRHNVTTEQQAAKSFEETVREHQTDELLRQAGLDVQQRGQDVQVRGQDIDYRAKSEGETAATERAKLTSKTQITDTLIHALSGNANPLHPEQATQMLAKVLALRGDPELLKVVGEQPTGTTKSATAEATLRLLQGDGTVGANGVVNPNAVVPRTNKNAELDTLLQNVIPAYGTGRKLNRATGNNAAIHTLLKLLVPAYGITDELVGAR